MAAMLRSKRRSTRLTNSVDPGAEAADTVTVKEEVDDDFTSVKIKEELLDESASLSDTGLPSNDSSFTVSSEAAQSNPTSQVPNPEKTSKFSKQAAAACKKPFGSRHAMTLNEIWALTDKQLVQNFSELTSNEMTRNFAYTCYLMPEKCAEIFTSFGSENKAKSEMQYHLLSHLRVLLNEAKDNPDFVFTAQTMHSRRKYGPGLDKPGYKRRKFKDVVVVKKPSIDKTDLETDVVRLSPVATVRTSFVEQNDAKTSASGLQIVPVVKRGRRSNKTETEPPKIPDATTDDFLVEVKMELDNSPDIDVAPADVTNEPANESPASGATKSAKEKNIAETFRKQPFIDHSYFADCHQREKKEDSKESNADIGASRTSGWKYGLDQELDEDDKQILSVVIRIHTGSIPIPNKLYIPMVRVPKMMAVQAQSNVGVETGDIDSKEDENVLNSSLAVKSNVTTKSLQSDGDSNEEDEEEDLSNLKPPVVKKRRRFETTNPALENEKKLALMYINELRCKKKDELLVCKICKNKPFTATATLLYHYRSHAGIKPFVCLICNTTFTRQHSLNYHMLIHYNQNRFTCKDCGRMFRHPSHYKEHLRRHTGETPFLCTDCPQRFKTRNTYKRHLRTRHGKLLLASGIRIMSRDEFLKVRTKPYLDEKTEDDAELEKGATEDEVEVKSPHKFQYKLLSKPLPKPLPKPMPKPIPQPTFPSGNISRKPAILCRSSSANRNITNNAKKDLLPL